MGCTAFIVIEILDLADLIFFIQPNVYDLAGLIYSVSNNSPVSSAADTRVSFPRGEYKFVGLQAYLHAAS